MQQNHFALSWIHFRCCFNVELAKATCIPSLPSFFSTNTAGKAQGLLFSAIWLFINSTGASPSCVGLWMKIMSSVNQILFDYHSLFTAGFGFSGNIFFGTMDNCHAGLNCAASLHRACFWCGCKWVTDFSLCFSSILSSALPGYL